MVEHGWRGAPYDASRYGSEHKRARSRWAPIVATGRVSCWRCGLLIRRGQRWHLGHSDDGRTYRGPEHRECNLRAASAQAHARRWSRDPEPEPRTRWR